MYKFSQALRATATIRIIRALQNRRKSGIKFSFIPHHAGDIIGHKTRGTPPYPVILSGTWRVHPAVISKPQNILHGNYGKPSS